MRKVLSLIAVVGLLASLASAALANPDSDALQQEVSTPADHREPLTEPFDDGGIIYLPPSRSRSSTNLEGMMQQLIEREMKTTYRESDYVNALKAAVCGKPVSIPGNRGCQIEVLSKPVIRVIPTKAVSKDIYCSTPSCSIGLEEGVSISTTHSVEVSVSITAGAKPFGIGMEFTATAGYGFSDTTEESTTLLYNFDLAQGDAGYIGIVNAEVSAEVRVSECRCWMFEFDCINKCATGGMTISETGHHEAVILKNGKPRSYVSFVYTNK